MPHRTSAPPEPPSSEERRSFFVFSGILLLSLLAVAFPEMPAQALLGILWTGAGLLMLIAPPTVKVPRLWAWLTVGFLLTSALGFLPRTWFHVPQWRLELESLGLDTGSTSFVQPLLAAEALAGFAATAIVVLFLMGHRIGNYMHHRLALAFALGIGLWITSALILQHPGEVFGFFPNRNHTATLLAMGCFAGIGSLAHAVRLKAGWKIGLSIIPLALCLYALLAASESRAGIVLITAGFAAWLVLTGFRQLQGHSGKAVILLLFAFIGVFLTVESPVKTRLTKTVQLLETSVPANAPGSRPSIPIEAALSEHEPASVDGRVAIFLGTWTMIRNEPWTGVGPNQFARVFPQYREKFDIPNSSICLHPESDWLMMLAEIGWPATLCLAAAVFTVFFTGFKRARHGRARALRMGTLVAALLLCIHGLFDVPGHRIGLAWSAALLLAISLRPPSENGKSTCPSRASRLVWRSLGLLPLIGGLGLLHAQWTEKPLLPSAEISQRMTQAKALSDQDQAAYDKATAAGQEYKPEPAFDPLESALPLLAEVNHLAPLDPYPYYLRGSLALHYDDKQEIAEKAFAIQRRLDPTRVNLTMEQALAWNLQEPRQVLALWKEALHRASLEESRLPGSSFGFVETYQRAVHDAGKDESRVSAALELAGNDPSLLLIWARSAPAILLDREMPHLLANSNGSDARKPLFQTWEKRGSKGAAANFATSHPELGLSSP